MPAVPNDDAVTYVPESGHRLSGGFRDFYLRAGGLAVLGPPLTEELVEDGVTRAVLRAGRAGVRPRAGRCAPPCWAISLLRERGWLK